MKLMGAALGGLLGGAIGAAVWALIVYQFNVEIGWIAVGIGALVGFGVAVGAKGETGMPTGVLAAVIAVGAILAGKFIAVQQVVGDVLASDVGRITEEDARIHLADTLVAEYERDGKALRWPDGMSVETASEEAHYPKNLWADMDTRWQRMTPEAREEYRAGLEAYTHGVVRTYGSQAAFIESFTLIDVAFFGLAVVVAYGAGARTDE